MFYLWVVISINLYGQVKESHCQKINKVVSFIKLHHYNPDSIDSEFEEKINNTFIANMDPHGLFLTLVDLNKIKSFCPNLSTSNCSSYVFSIDSITNIYKQKLLIVDSLISNYSFEILDFNTHDSIALSEQGMEIYAIDDKDHKRLLTQKIKFHILKYYFSTYQANDSLFVKNFESLNESKIDLLNYVVKKERCKIAHLLDQPNEFSEYILNLYLKSVTSCFDPHSAYFTFNEKMQFESSISTNNYSFGADLDINDDGEIFIARLIPGGPAWRSKELKVGDVILKLQFPGKEKIELICSNLNELEDIMYNSGSNQIFLTVQSSFGLVKTVELNMEFIQSSENEIYSFILNGDKKVGYISLPGFYTEPDVQDPLGCASDLAKAILKLKEDKVEGIILDVRNNGGGSVTEAVDLAGIFIHSGPLCLYASKYQKPMVIKDLNRGTIYSGPLVLLVNGSSASASELLAGILKDYNRALIVGNTTFGKGTGQNIYSLDNHGQYNPNAEEFVKLTTTKFYQLSGKSHQAIGIVPDISLPAYIGYSKINESNLPSALKNDFVEKEIIYEKLDSLPIFSVKEASEVRIKENLNFQKYITLNESIGYLFSDNIQVPLNFQLFKNEYTTTINQFKQIESLTSMTGNFYRIVNNSFDEKMLKYDDYKMCIHSEFISELMNDIFLEETYLIISDMIHKLKIQD